MALRHVSGGYLERTSGFTDLFGKTICGWGVRKANRSATSCICLVRDENSGQYGGIYSSDGSAFALNMNGTARPTRITLTDDRPYFWALTHSGSNTSASLVMYIQFNDTAALASDLFPTANFTVGVLRVGDDGYGDWCDAESNGLMMFNRLLTVQEIDEQRRSRTPIDRRGLMCWLPEISTASAAANAVDFSGAGFDWTVQGAPIAVAGSMSDVAWELAA